MIIIMTIVMIVIVIMIMTIIIIVSIIIIIILIIINTSVSRAPTPVQLGGKPASVSCMNGNVPFTSAITDELTHRTAATQHLAGHFASLQHPRASLPDKQLGVQRCMGTSQLAPAPLARSLWRV